jgi:uncharacterized phage protein (TIGR02218 family)
MKPASTALATFLASLPRNGIMADCYTLTLSNGDAFYFTDADVPVVIGSTVFVASSLRVQGMQYSSSIGADVDEQDISILASGTDTILGVPVMQAFVQGVLDGAYLQRDRGFLPAWGSAAIGSLPLFHGRVSTIESIGDLEAKIKVKSDLVVLDADFPRNIYSAACLHVLFDSGCGLNKASYGMTGVTATGSTISKIAWSAASLGTYNQGTLEFTSGVNAGVTRNITQSDGTYLWLSYPLDNPPGIGDGFIAYPGCDHTAGAGGCSKFSNLANRRSFDFVPPPSAAL